MKLIFSRLSTLLRDHNHATGNGTTRVSHQNPCFCIFKYPKNIIILNDHNDQLTMPKYGAQVTTVQNFRKQSSIFGITIDIATGKMTRKLIAANKDDVVLMPRHAFREGDQLIIPSWRMHSYAKTELKFARLAME